MAAEDELACAASARNHTDADVCCKTEMMNSNGPKTQQRRQHLWHTIPNLQKVPVHRQRDAARSGRKGEKRERYGERESHRSSQM